MARVFMAMALAPQLAIAVATPLSQEATSSAIRTTTAPVETTTTLEEIVVTAQKRAQSITDVPMSVLALDADALTDAGVTDASELSGMVPGLTYTKTPESFPIFSVRGIGFYDNNLSSSPAVTAYVDEVALPYAILTGGATLDLERVEVLKGPQGTLFGQNSTGGALNFIAAKPTEDFAAGANLSYGRFETAEFDGFLSGPLSNTLKARLAVRTEHSGDWQESYTRKDSSGATDRSAARLLVDWTPNETFDAELNLNGWRDSSDVQRSQIVGLSIIIPGNQDPRLASGDGSPGNPFVQVYPDPPREDARAADWTSGVDYAADHKYWQAALRANYRFNDVVALTSLTSYQDMDYLQRSDADGTALQIGDFRISGLVEAFSQELRLSGDSGRLNWMIGGNYFRDRVNSVSFGREPDVSIGFDSTDAFNHAEARTWAGFANAEYRLTDRWSVLAGARYTDFEQDFHGCLADTGDGTAAAVFEFFTGAPLGIFLPGECITMNDVDGSFLPSEAFLTTAQDNVSWRAGVNYQPRSATLLYANISRGYKTGSFPLATTSFHSLLRAPEQESVLAYEIGVKQTLAQRALQLNGAVFYYDYRDKQLLFPFLDEVIGIQELLRNIPKSRVIGAELEMDWSPVQDLVLRVNGTYLDSEVRSEFSGPTSDGLGVIDIQGEPFPYTPEWQAAASADYRFPLTAAIYGSFGGSLTYRSVTVARFQESSLFGIDSYTLLDLRAGIEGADGRWSVQIWGRNVADEYYRVNVGSIFDTVVAFTGRPLTYGITVGTRF